MRVSRAGFRDQAWNGHIASGDIRERWPWRVGARVRQRGQALVEVPLRVPGDLQDRVQDGRDGDENVVVGIRIQGRVRRAVHAAGIGAGALSRTPAASPGPGHGLATGIRAGLAVALRREEPPVGQRAGAVGARRRVAAMSSMELAEHDVPESSGASRRLPHWMRPITRPDCTPKRPGRGSVTQLPGRRDAPGYPQEKTGVLVKLTVTVPFAFSTNTAVWWAVMAEPSEPVRWMVSVKALLVLRSLKLPLPHAVALPV